MFDPAHALAVRRISPVAMVLLACLISATLPHASAELRVGTAVADIAPTKLPVLITGGFLGRTADTIRSPLLARAIVLDDGRERIAIVVADNCALPRELIDEAKQGAAQRTRIRPDRMLIAATHTHSAPPGGGLGTDAEPEYAACCGTNWSRRSWRPRPGCSRSASGGPRLPRIDAWPWPLWYEVLRAIPVFVQGTCTPQVHAHVGRTGSTGTADRAVSEIHVGRPRPG